MGVLLGAYFHQDWGLDDPTADAVVRRFSAEETGETVARARADIEQVLQHFESEADLDALIYQLHGYYLPSADGLSAREWLTRVGELLRPAG